MFDRQQSEGACLAIYAGFEAVVLDRVVSDRHVRAVQ